MTSDKVRGFQPPNMELKARREALMALARLVVEKTGYKWKATSFLRASESHANGSALDIAPEIAESAKFHYAVSLNSDPLLDRRSKLIKILNSVIDDVDSLDQHYDYGIFVETDHLHLQLFKKLDLDSPSVMVVAKWGKVKFCYPDSASRRFSNLPFLSPNKNDSK